MIDPKKYEKYAKYLIYDDEGKLLGIKEDAPKSAKLEFEKQVEFEKSFIDKNEPIPR